MLTTHELVNVLTARVNLIEKQLRDCQRENMALAGQIKTMMSVTSIPQRPKFEVPKNMIGRQSKIPSDVQARWSMWKLMHESGMNDCQIGRECKVCRTTVSNARRMNWNAKEGCGK